MIYVASLGVTARKAFGTNYKQTTASKIIDLMSIDPRTSGMDTVLLGPNDLGGSYGIKLSKAVAQSKHKDICIIYLYEKESQADKLDCTYKKGFKKITAENIKGFVMESIAEFKNNTGELENNINDLYDDDDEEAAPVDVSRLTTDTVERQNLSDISMESENIDVTVPRLKVNEDIIADVFVPKPEETPEPKVLNTQEEMIKNIADFQEWNVLKEQVNKDSVMKRLIEENSEYSGLIQTIEVYDYKIRAIWADESLTAEQRLESIRDIGLQKSVYKSKSNSIMTDKVVGIIDAIATNAKRVVDETVRNKNESLAHITLKKKDIMDTSVIDSLINKKTNIQLELLCVVRGIIELYKSMDLLVTDSIMELDSKLPSSNEFINNMVGPVNGNLFTPKNSGELATKLMSALQDNRVTMSQLEDKVQQIIQLIFSLCDVDNELLEQRKNMSELLKAQRVEDIVVKDSILKYALNLYVGMEDSGHTATSLTWAGVLSRRTNVLLVDITGKAKFDRYGMQTVSMSDFMMKRENQKILCVESGKRLDTEELAFLIDTLKTRLDYYGFINIMVSADDTEALKMLAEHALTINYITDCRAKSIEALKTCTHSFETTNVGRKLIMIDAPINPLQVSEMINIDPTRVKLVPIPNLPTVKACAIKHDRPYDYDDVRTAYEEAFR